MVYPLRRSQFILSSGPGAIIEGRNGPKIMPRPDIALPSDFSPADFEIAVSRHLVRLFGGKRFFRMPSNIELRRDEDAAVYRTKRFPGWGLCAEHGILNRISRGCEECSNGRPLEAIRFVSACIHGHLDDVSWSFVVHQNEPCDDSAGYWWRRAGGALRDIEISCRTCGKSINFGKIYSRSWRCSGRYPEQEQLNAEASRQGCAASSHIIQRQAANLRVPEILSFFTIPPCITALHQLVQISHIYNPLVTTPLSSQQDFTNRMTTLLEHNLAGEQSIAAILRYDWTEVVRALQDVIDQRGVESYSELLSMEFTALLNASSTGVPPRPRPANSYDYVFEVDINAISDYVVDGRNFRVTPVKKLKTIVVQKGYKRPVQDELNAQMVDISFSDQHGDSWLPCTEFIGEGIFISFNDLSSDQNILNNNQNHKWLGCFEHPEQYPPFLFRDSVEAVELHPAFIWWHTLAHLLIRVLAVDSGYSAASIRERIYIDKRPDGSYKGGIILYCVQPGGDGSMGGLISLVPKFDQILQRAFDMSRNCSNDPLCYNEGEGFTVGTTHNGASCYGCLFISETSCEHRNLWLDRRVLRGVNDGG